MTNLTRTASALYNNKVSNAGHDLR